MLTQYISKEGAERLKNYQYNGTCESILYSLCLSRFAQSIVDRFPMWLAPNTITMTGFTILLSAITAHLVMNPTLTEPMPSWLCYYSAFCLFMYQTLDNCDGKQARKTGSATPLGMLLDHGTDCLVQWLLGIVLISIFTLGTGPLSFISWTIVACVSFYFAIYQQEHTGLFKLNKINGVDEGLPFIQFMFVVTGLLGTSFWQSNVPYLDVKANTIVCCFLLAGGFNEIVTFGKPAIEKIQKPIQILWSLRLPLTYLTTIVLLIVFATDDVRKYQMLMMFALGFQWSKIIVMLQVSMITKERLKLRQFSWVFVQVALLVIFLTPIPEKVQVPKEYFLYGLILYSFGAYMRCVLSFIYQITSILEIRVFSIGVKDI